MPRKRAGRAMWFKVTLHQKPLIDSVPDDVAGKALKAAMCYFENGKITDLDPLTAAVFSVFKVSVDEAVSGYTKAVEDGTKGGRPKVTGGNPPLPMVTHPIPRVTEEDIRLNTDGQQPPRLEGRAAGEYDHYLGWKEES